MYQITVDSDYDSDDDFENRYVFTETEDEARKTVNIIIEVLNMGGQFIGPSVPMDSFSAQGDGKLVHCQQKQEDEIDFDRFEGYIFGGVTDESGLASF